MNWLENLFYNYISPIGEIGILIATFVLLYLTSKYIKFTKRMADIMKQEYEMKIKPLVKIRFDGFLSRGANFQPRLYVHNYGDLLIKLLNYKVKCWHKDFENDSIVAFEKQINEEITPDNSLRIDDSFSLSDLPHFPLPEEPKIPLVVEFTFTFLDAKGNEFTKKELINKFFPQI